VTTAMTMTSKQAAQRLGVTRTTLYFWLRSGRITPPKQTKIGGSSFFLWSEADVQRVLSYKTNRPKRPGRPVGSKNRQKIGAVSVSV